VLCQHNHHPYQSEGCGTQLPEVNLRPHEQAKASLTNAVRARPSSPCTPMPSFVERTLQRKAHWARHSRQTKHSVITCAQPRTAGECDSWVESESILVIVGTKGRSGSAAWAIRRGRAWQKASNLVTPCRSTAEIVIKSSSASPLNIVSWRCM